MDDFINQSLESISCQVECFDSSLNQILQKMGIGIWQWDTQTNEVELSENIPLILGMGEEGNERIKTSRNQCISMVHEEDVALVKNEFNRCVQEGVGVKIEYRIKPPNGGVRWIQNRAHIIRSDAVSSACILGAMIDITQRKEMESAVIAAREEAARQSEIKSAFIARLSHELKTPLNSIIGFSQLLASGPNLSDIQKEDVQQIYDSGVHLNSMVDEMLDKARIEAGKVVIRMESLLVIDLLYKCVKMVSVECKKNGQTVITDYRDLSDIYIRTDRKRMTQVVLNLLSNAIKYNRRDGMIVVCCAINNGVLRFSVADEGEGIPYELQGKLFQPFERLGADASDIKGHGMGLVISKQLIELMGGRIGFESEPGCGSTFWIEMPYA